MRKILFNWVLPYVSGAVFAIAFIMIEMSYFNVSQYWAIASYVTAPVLSGVLMTRFWAWVYRSILIKERAKRLKNSISANGEATILHGVYF